MAVQAVERVVFRCGKCEWSLALPPTAASGGGGAACPQCGGEVSRVQESLPLGPETLVRTQCPNCRARNRNPAKILEKLTMCSKCGDQVKLNCIEPGVQTAPSGFLEPEEIATLGGAAGAGEDEDAEPETADGNSVLGGALMELGDEDGEEVEDGDDVDGLEEIIHEDDKFSMDDLDAGEDEGGGANADAQGDAPILELEYPSQEQQASPPEQTPAGPDSTKECPYCGESILTKAKKCKHCGSKVPQKSPNVSPGSAVFIILFAIFFYLFLYSQGCFSGRRSSSSSGKANSVEIGGDGRLNCTCYGALTEADLDRAFSLMQAKDEEALVKMRLAGRIIHLPVGTHVVVEDKTLLGKARVRVKGKIDSIWVFSAWIE